MAPPQITSATLTDPLQATPYDPGVDGMPRYPHTRVYVNYLYIQGQYFGLNPQVRLDHDQVGVFRKLEQINDPAGTWIKYWFWCTPVNGGGPPSPSPPNTTTLSTLSVVVETWETGEDTLHEANNGSPIAVVVPIYP